MGESHSSEFLPEKCPYVVVGMNFWLYVPHKMLHYGRHSCPS